MPDTLSQTIPSATVAVANDATRRRDRIKLLLSAMTTTTEKISELLEAAQADEDHRALGYASWTAYLAGEYADALAGLSTAARRPAVAALADGGLSTRAIAEIAGVGQSTVGRDLQVTRSGSPGEAEARKVVGRDGKSYDANRPAQRDETQPGDGVPTEAELSELMIRALAEFDPALLLFVRRALEQWPHRPHTVAFPRVAVPALILGYPPQVLSRWLYCAAECVIQECESTRDERSAPGWTLPGVEALAGLVIATLNPALSDSTRQVLGRRVEGQMAVALVESEWTIEPGILRAVYEAAGIEAGDGND